MPGTTKEELGRRFRTRVDSVLLGLDAFWHGADFPGPTLEYLVIVRLPFGVPDRFHRAQCAAMGPGEQRRSIYLPRALARFRQGFGRLMRTETDRGCAFVLDRRVLDPRHRVFLGELPLRETEALLDAAPELASARLLVSDTDDCIGEGLAHMGMRAEVRSRGLALAFTGWALGDA
jgi:ATP-dependent DNA helicase DinG